MTRYAAEEYNYYANWVLHAVLGLLAEADGLMNEHGAAIRRMAKKLREDLGCPIRRVYRGVLLRPQDVPEDLLVAPQGPETTFSSWSEDRDVGCWFASTETVLAGVVMAMKPDAEGWVMEATPLKSHVLYHHSWADRFPWPSGSPGVGLSRLGAMHVSISMQISQLNWNLHTQKEVILKRSDRLVPIEPRDNFGCPPTWQLDDRLMWPEFRANPNRSRS